MKRNVLCAAMVLLAGSVLAADKDDVSAAIAKLAAADNYSWKTSTTNIPPPGADANAGGGRRGRGGFGGGAVDGKVQKDGLIYVAMPGRGGAVTEGYVKGAKGAIKAGDDAGWTSLADATADDGGGGFNMAAFAARRVQNTKAPADTAKDLLSKTKSVSKTGDSYTADLTEDGAKGLMTAGFGGFRGGGDGQGPDISGAKGTVKFWVKDGVLTKYETDVQGSIDFGGNSRDMHPVTTIEIREVGTTKIDVPADAKKSLS
ncbi:MAG: hypothetical protein ABSG78_22035 [Verrucomicrobiota bacterium]|jgi:hypothetical protein